MDGEKTTWPLGISVAPENDVPVGVEFEKFRETGSNIPTFEDPTFAVNVRDGVKMMFPEGKRHPPPKKAVQLAFDTGTVTVEDVKAEGLMTRMLEF